MNSVLTVKVEAHEFVPRDFVGGDPALDFVNTVTGRDGTPRDWLDSYARLLDWAELARLLPKAVLRALRKKAKGEADMAASALERAKELREALFSVATGTISGEAPPGDALALLHENWALAISAHELRFENGRVVPGLRDDEVGLDLVSAMVAYRMVEHVLPAPRGRLRICQGPNCSWLFIDRSKAGRRRWCDMAVCGNAAKARRFHARSRVSD